MNDVYCVYVEGTQRGLNYNPMYKFNSVEEFVDRVESGDNVPDKHEIVVEVWRMDNIIINKPCTFDKVCEHIKTLFYTNEDEDLDF